MSSAGTIPSSLARGISDMTRLSMLLFSIVSTTLMGMFIVVALVLGYDTLTPIIVAAAAGFVAAVPASWMLARMIAAAA
jgi:predicted PurR-regulated permease PerM